MSPRKPSAKSSSRLDGKKMAGSTPQGSAWLEKDLRGLLESAPDAMLMVNRAGEIVLVNSQTEKMFGYKRREILGRPVEILLPERARKKHEKHRSVYIKSPYTRPMGAGLDLLGVRKDGSEFPVEISLSSMKAGRELLITAIIRDATDRKRHEKEMEKLNLELERRVAKRTAQLQEERDRAQKYLDVAGVVVVVIETDQNVALVNRKGCEVLGHDEREVVGKNWFDHFIPLRIREQVRSAFKQIISGDLDSVEYYENPILTRSGEERVIAWHNTVLRDESGRIQATLSSGEDITDRAELERQIIRSERMVALGEMAASLAHEFNNPLGIIMGFAQDLLTEVDPSDPRHHSLKIIEEESRRCKKLMRDLLEFGRPTLAEFVQVDPAEVIRRSIELASGKLQKSAIRPILNLPKELPKIWADAQQLQQVLLNLVFNAMDAMPQGGILTLGAEWVGDREGPKPSDQNPESGVEISVSDSGHGIDPADLDKIFRPFYSVRKKKGVGLGLAVCESIMKAHGGRISVQSRPGHGATFTLFFPEERRVQERSDISGENRTV